MAEKIYGAMVKVMQEVDAIGKDMKNASQGFNFRGVDQVYNALHPILARNGIFITTRAISRHKDERQNTKGTTLFYHFVEVEFSFNADDGSKVSSTLIGEAMDSGDKGLSKAFSVALKYCLFQAFLIPTEDAEADTVSHEVAPAAKRVPAGEDATLAYAGGVPTKEQVIQGVMKMYDAPRTEAIAIIQKALAVKFDGRKMDDLTDPEKTTLMDKGTYE